MAVTSITNEEQATTPEETLEQARENFETIPMGKDQPSFITSDELEEVQDIDAVQPRRPTKDAAVEGAVDASMEETITKPEEVQEVRQQEQSVFQDIIGKIEGQETSTELQAQAEQEAGLQEVEKELNSIDQQIRMEKRSLQNQIERIREEGGSKQFVQRETQIARRESLSKQADLAVMRQGVQQQFDSAKAIADRQVQMEFEQQENEIEAAQLTYQRFQDLLSKKEQRLYQERVAERERIAQVQKAQKQQISDFSIEALRNGAPISVASLMRQADTVDEALQIGGQYVGRLDRLQAQADLRGQQLSNQQAVLNLQRSIQETNNEVQKVAQSSKVSEVVSKLPSAGERSLVVGAAATTKAAEQLIDLIENKGVETGPITGTFERGINIPFTDQTLIPGKAQTGFANEKQQRFEAAATVFTANFIKAISGAQVSDRERQFLMRALPDLTKQEDVNIQGIKEVVRALNNQVQAQTGNSLSDFEDVPDILGEEQQSESQDNNQSEDLSDLNFQL